MPIVLGRLWVYEFPRTVVTKHHKLGGLNDRNVLSHGSGGYMSEIKMLAMLVPSEGREGGSVPGLSPSFWWLQALLGF